MPPKKGKGSIIYHVLPELDIAFHIVHTLRLFSAYVW